MSKDYITTIPIESNDKSKTKPNDGVLDTFITEVVRNVKAGKVDYAFTLKQLDKVKERLTETELKNLVITKEDYYYSICLKSKRKEKCLD